MGGEESHKHGEHASGQVDHWRHGAYCSEIEDFHSGLMPELRGAAKGLRVE
jgi:hypothetical protein